MKVRNAEPDEDGGDGVGDEHTSYKLHTRSSTNTHLGVRKACVCVWLDLLCAHVCVGPLPPVRVWVRVPSRTPPSLLLITTNWLHSFFFVSPLRYNGIIHLYNLMSRHSRHRARSSATSIEKTKAETNEGGKDGGDGAYMCSETRRKLLGVIFFFGNIKNTKRKVGKSVCVTAAGVSSGPRAHRSTRGNSKRQTN